MKAIALENEEADQEHLKSFITEAIKEMDKLQAENLQLNTKIKILDSQIDQNLEHIRKNLEHVETTR
jgi:hypothetical protein